MGKLFFILFSGFLLAQGLCAQDQFKKIVLQPNTTCVINSQNKLYCWGTYSAQIGDFLGGESIPKLIHDLPKVADMQMGDSIACILSTDGQVKCWGNDRGKEVLPQVVRLPSPASRIYVKQFLQCAHLEDGDLYCWRQFPNIDDKTEKKSIEPTKISFPSSINKFFDSSGLCVLLDNGNLWCWDSYHIHPKQKAIPDISLKYVRNAVDFYYVTNEGKAFKEEGNKLVAIAGLDGGVKILKSNYGKYCAVMEIGTVKCYGQNDNGSILPMSDKMKIIEAVEVPSITDAIDVDVMLDITCALLKDGKIKCWGGGFNFLGNGNQAAVSPYDFRLPKTK